ncbi:MAG: glycosyltransferase family 2 protein [Candidatus Thioglobus sp.]|uniref:glycosyltransferase n=1 Tax=Candidatus Thioglobus sp. TaxID=2026721 RepID=UPI002632AA47|nr:glycosyltransferase family 2 protein [Candidatus Thioglobus sp.]MDC9727396.1 glycosyltransferase family 2 protein [Candidatus Thioglobus sp.]
MPLDLSIIIPTFNESGNIKALIELLHNTIDKSITWEIIFVDDNSPDKTYQQVQKLSKDWNNVRVLRRVGRRGLSSAVIEGILSSSADYFLVMDGDLQHDEGIIPRMFASIKQDNLDLVIGSRFVGGGSTGELALNRVKVSRFATILSHRILKTKLTDPMSGFFMLSRAFFEQNVERLSAIGFKILLDLVASAKTPPKLIELPYQMRKRTEGESKLEPIVVWEYLLLLLDKSIGRFIPLRFMMFILVGLSGVLVHLVVLKGLLNFTDYSFLIAQSMATLVAMTNNYIFNNLFTYSDKRLTGFKFFKGLLSFYLACSIGFVINITLAEFLFKLDVAWYLSGLIGAVIGSIWNYGMTKYITWR